MNWEVIFVLALLLGAIFSFTREKIPADLTSLSVFAFLAIGAAFFPQSKLPSVPELLSVFSNPAPITIASMFIISAGLERCGVINSLTVLLQKTTRFGYRRFLLFLIIPVALVSAFINNTPVVVILLPVAISLSANLGVPASKVLIPLSYASIFGGTCTLMGTSTNILGSSLLSSSGYEPFTMFEFAAVAAPLAIIGTLYLTLFGKWLLPDRESLGSLIPAEARKEYLAEAFVRGDSPLVGKRVEETKILKQAGIRLVELIRSGTPIPGDLRKTVLRGGDRVVLACRPSGIAEAREFEGIILTAEKDADLEPISARQASIVEAMVAPNSPAAGRTIAEMNFRQRFRTLILAVHRDGKNLNADFQKTVISAGDTILLLGPDESLEALRRSGDLVLLDQPAVPADTRRRKAPIAIGVLAGVVLLATLNLAPIAVSTILGVSVLFLTGCLKPQEGYQSVEWKILILIYGMLGLGMAMESSGATHLFTNFTQQLVEGFVAPSWRPFVLLAVIYLISSIFTEFLSNNATVVLMVPVAMSLAISMGVDPRPFAIACCIGSSASFATPIGYQTNTLVYGVGAYRFTDFMRIGLPLNILYAVGTILLVPLIWGF
ncbi:SLC13 family permease [Puniceicoccus vermicola]|uniref:SLC13 family permease n=1 Tax=Puniceicoccus vermicola TaxID=388746 RepID=A0A7X1E4E5_9BACT|nr:SLC13 family permease [Puniceicoccus vermicola]MBC2601908.1 SLC13 family permease [Puniceicoccus vermicola]